MANEWQIPEQLHKADVELLKLALTQSDIRQKDIEATSSNITNRVQTILSVFVGVVVAAMGFFLSHKSDGIMVILPTLTTILYGLILSYRLIQNAYTGKYIPVGGTPSTLLPVKLLQASGDNVRIQNLYFSLLYGADKRIKTNANENQRRWDILEGVTKAAIWMPIAVGFSFLVSLCLDYYF